MMKWGTKDKRTLQEAASLAERMNGASCFVYVCSFGAVANPQPSS